MDNNKLDIEKIREDFPALHQTIHGKPLIYLDNAATTLKPKRVIDSIIHHYSYESANVHRGVHYLSEMATEKFESTRQTIKEFINAPSTKEIIFTTGTTGGINLIAQSWGPQNITAGDDIIVSWMEHHSNIVPWQMLAQKTGANLKIIPIDDNGELNLEEYKKLLSSKTKIVAITAASNALGTINPIKKIIALAKEVKATTLIDAAQAIAHQKIDVVDLACDFLVFSSHKIYGPTGIGALYGKEELLEKMPPLQGGGDMIEYVSFEKTTYNQLPYKFEAGTPNIAGVIGFGEALRYVQDLGIENIESIEHELRDYATSKLLEIKGLKIIGNAKEKGAIISFVLDNVHPHDIGTMTDQAGIAIRTGHHCAQPIMQRYNVPATARASFAFYNTKEEIDQLAAAIIRTQEFFT